MDKVSISLVKLRLNQAKEDLEDSKYLYDKNSFKGVNNRAYYSIFHTMKAILALEPTDFKKHKDVISYFNKNYINKEIFPKEFGHKIKKAEIIRDNSDYNDFYIVSKVDTEDIIKTATTFYDFGVNYTKEWCKSNNIDYNNVD